MVQGRKPRLYRMRRLNVTDFSQLIEGCRKEDRRSQHELYRLYYAYGMSICIRYVSDEQEAKAVLNGGFLKVFSSIGRFDENKPFKPWLRRILINTALNHIKREERFKPEVELDEARDIPGPEEIISQLGYQELMGLVQSLSPAYRAVFNLYVIDGFKHDEIAEKLGISVGTSKSNLTRARANLKLLVSRKLNLVRERS